jgi:uncharacterized protein (DUF1330 family)
MFAYVVVDAKIIDPDQQKQYGAKAAYVVAKFGGEYLARHTRAIGDCEISKL